jgi:hypothetical protein
MLYSLRTTMFDHKILSFHKIIAQEEQAGVELRNRYMNMVRSNSQDRNSETRSIRAT